MKKRVFSMLLALVMALSLLPTMAVAGKAWGQDKYFELQYNDCNYGGSSHASITVDGNAKSAGFHSFTQKDMQFELTPDSTMPEEEIAPFVEIEVFDGSAPGAQTFVPNARYESRCETADESKRCYPLSLSKSKSDSTYSFIFTPASDHFFSVRVYWGDRDRYETFGFNENEEIQLRYRVFGNADVNFTFDGNDRGRVNYHDDSDGYQYCKQNLTKVTTSIGVTLQACDGFAFKSAEFCKDGEEPVSISETDRPFTWNSDYFDWELNVVFEGPNNPGGNGGPQGDPQGGTRWDVLRSEIEGYTFAYGPASGSGLSEQNMLKAGIAAELYARKMGNGPRSSDTTLGMALGYDPEHGSDMSTAEAAIKAGITINNDKTSGGIAGCSYYTFSVNITTKADNTPIDVNPEQAGNQPFTASGKVYVLQKDNDFILKTTKTTEGVSKTEYKIASYAGSKNNKSEGVEGNEEADRFVYAPFDVYGRMEPAIEAYGNGIFLNNAISEDRSVFGFHAACEHCGSIGKINCRLIVSSAADSIQISSTDDAAAWNFINVGVYNAMGTVNKPVNATIFFGSETISFSKATGNKEVTNVEAVDLPAGAVTFKGGTLTFNTNYDEIKVKVTYGTGESATEGYMLLHRVGLNIDSIQIDKQTDVLSGNRFSPADKAQCTADTFNVWHGSDQSVRYVSSEDHDQVVVCSFYYDCNYYVKHDTNCWHVYSGDEFVADSIVTGNSTGFNSMQAAVDALRTSIESVQLLVTITDVNDNVTRKLVNAPLSGAKAVNNGGFVSDGYNAVGYAGQGSNHVYDDFLLWSGSEAEYANIKSVSAIVYNAGNANTFGGVKVGSGTGVLWENN